MAKSPERVQFLRDVMITALEGGVGYWSVADQITIEHENDDLWYARYTLFCLDGDDPTGKEAGECGLSTQEAPVPLCQGHLIDPDAIARGMGLARRPADQSDAIGWHISNRRHVIKANRENDAGDIDAGDADCIVQLAAFGKVIYG
jgi:hypothetical protein